MQTEDKQQPNGEKTDRTSKIEHKIRTNIRQPMKTRECESEIKNDTSEEQN